MDRTGPHALSPSFAVAPNEPRAPLVDARALAVELGVSREFVYEHANDLVR